MTWTNRFTRWWSMTGSDKQKKTDIQVSPPDLQQKLRDMEIQLRHIENENRLSQNESRTATLKYIEVMEELRRKNESLETWKHQLEERVRIRTSSLEASNKALMEEIEKNRAIQNELREKDKRLLHAQKMEAVGILAGGIAHDFNNLLMYIQGNISLVLLGMNASHIHYDKIKNIEEQVKSGVALTRQLLNFATQGERKLLPLDLNEVISKTVAMFARTRKEITVEMKLDEKLGRVNADRGQIEQILLNLYVNASHAMPGGGQLILRTENVSLSEEEARLFLVEAGDFVQVSVGDTGIGMDGETRERIFDPFFTTKGMDRGYGLGLTSVYGIVKGHQGFIDVRSQKGEGSTFLFYLPKTTGAMAEQDGSAEEVILGGRETVLFVDDERTIIEVMEETLETLGYRVLTADNGEEAIRLYREGKEEIDLVILDVIMPGMGGMETFEAMKAINNEVKVIFSSGYSVDHIAREIMDRGCRAFIQKPFNIETISRKVREVLQEV